MNKTNRQLSQRAWYERNRELVKERMVAWRLTNPERYKELCQRAYARKRAKTAQKRAERNHTDSHRIS